MGEVSRSSWRDAGANYLATLALAGVVGGGVLALSGLQSAANVAWAVVTAVLLVPLAASVVRSLRQRDAGVDAIALLAMGTALLLGEFLAGAIVGLMLAGGNALEGYASGRARRELRHLLEHAPHSAHRISDGRIEDIEVARIEPGDRLLVRAGEVLPADGTVLDTIASIDEAALTGESLPRSVPAGGPVRSGSLNVGEAIEVRADRRAEESAFAGIVRLVQAAEHERAPFVRLADRYAAVFLPITVVAALGAWLASGDEVRALAVLVVATPCPLILATPIAIIAGVSRAARLGIVIKGGAAIEALGGAGVVLLDKTGTITVGRPEIIELRVADRASLSEERLLYFAASLDQASAHVLAEALVLAAAERGIELAAPSGLAEEPGHGIRGVVDGHEVALGQREWVSRSLGEPMARAVPALPGAAVITVAVDRRPAGEIVLADPIRPDASELIDSLRARGIERLVLVSGDTREVVDGIAAQAGLDDVVADCSPEEKLEVVRAEQARGKGTVVMVGDGVNDAPALALADVGIAMGARGATAASESADAVLIVDRVDRVGAAIEIGRRSLRIARQGVIAGMALSIVAMGFAAAGSITPVAGALLQEGIDIAVILNALRALRA